ncbi:MAG: flagellar motor switch protein FliG, partial [Proteobacteria bacterium]|nr:flagellar motor switch protein FliG [Pseudomonadota bacterium]
MARIKDDYRALGGRQKAAIFLLSLGQKQSGILFERMDDEEIREIS